MFFEHLADEDDAALMRLFFDVGVFCFVPLSRVICDISSELFSFVAAGILTPVTCDIPFPGNTVNRCALNLTKTCTALAQNPFLWQKR